MPPAKKETPSPALRVQRTRGWRAGRRARIDDLLVALAQGAGAVVGRVVHGLATRDARQPAGSVSPRAPCSPNTCRRLPAEFRSRTGSRPWAGARCRSCRRARWLRRPRAWPIGHAALLDVRYDVHLRVIRQEGPAERIGSRRVEFAELAAEREELRIGELRPRKRSTMCSSHAARMRANVSAAIGCERSTPLTSAPSASPIFLISAKFHHHRLMIGCLRLRVDSIARSRGASSGVTNT